MDVERENSRDRTVCLVSKLNSGISAVSFQSSHSQRKSSISDGGNTVLTYSDIDDDDEHEERLEEEENDLNRLDFDNSTNFVGREDELEKLNSIYARMCQERSVTSDTNNKVVQIVLIDGYSGTGKSALVQQFIKPLLLAAKKSSTCTTHSEKRHNNYEPESKADSSRPSLPAAAKSENAKAKPCNFCQGKYDQYNTSGTLTAVVDAFSGFLSNLAESDEPYAGAELHRVTKAIRSKMDGTRQNLIGSMIPGLKLVLDKHSVSLSSSSAKLQEDQSLANNRSSNAKGSQTSNARVSRGINVASVSRDDAFEALDVSESRDAVWSQLLYGFKVLIRAIGTKSRPLVLYLDDLQWADQHSLDLITELLLDTSIHNLLIIGSYRTNEVHDVPEHRLNQAIPKWQSLKQTIHTIFLETLTQYQVGYFLANALRLDVKETEPLAAIMQEKTEGNILYIMQALEGLRRKKILTRNIHTLKWTWDNQQASKEISLSANVLDLIVSKLHSLPKALQRCLMVASFLRSTFNQAILEALIQLEICYFDHVENETLLQPSELDAILDLAINEGLLERTVEVLAISRSKTSQATFKSDNNKALFETTGSNAMLDEHGSTIPSQESKQKTIIRFAHDQIQQAAFSLVLPGNELEQMRYRMGKHLVGMANDPVLGENWMWFIAADQFESTSDLPISDDIIPALDLIRLNVRVGEMAIATSAFLPASKYLQRALHILETKVYNPWDSENDLCLQVHKLLSEVEMYLGHYEVGERLCKITLEHVDNISERVAVYASLGMALSRDGQNVEAVKMMMGALRMLKTFPQHFHALHLLKEARVVKKYLNKYTDEEILNLPLMTDKKMKYTMNLLRHVIHAAYDANDLPLVLLAMVRQVRLTFEYGLTGEGAAAFTACSSVLLNILKQKDLAERTSLLAMQMLELTNSKHVESQTIVTLGTFATPWWDPLHKTLAFLQRGYQSGMESGQIKQGYWGWMISLTTAFLAGVPLNQIQKAGVSMIEQLDHYRVTDVRGCYRYIHVLIEYLMGIRTRDDESSQSPWMWKEHHDLPPIKSIAKTDYRTWGFCSCSLLQLATYFGELEVAKKIIPISKKLNEDQHVYMMQIPLKFHCGLAYSRLARKTGKRKYIRRCRKEVAEMKSFVKVIQSANNVHRYLLMQADLLAATKASDAESVKDSYDKAISSAARSGAIHDCALGNELAGEHFLSRMAKSQNRSSSRGSPSQTSHVDATDDDNDYWSKQYLSNAVKLYGEWGAAGKVAHMRSRHGHLLDMDLILGSSNTHKRGSLHSTNT